MTFEDFIAPISVESFMRDTHDRAPIHIPGESGRERLLSWADVADLLGIRSHWVEPNIKLILNSRPIDPDFYMRETSTAAGTERLADGGLVHALMQTGASLVANSLEAISPPVRRATEMLAEQFAASSGANAYCSFGGVQAFGSHYDTHDVFAVQCEGEKRWRLYANRADAPLEPILGGAEAQALIDQRKGPVAAEIVMKRGDLLYIPRGVYHDAMASSASSLHVTFAVAPLTGSVLFDILADQAMQERAFRSYLPDARDEAALEERLEALATRLGELIRSPLFRNRLKARQRVRARPSQAVSLPERAGLDFFAPTGRGVQFDRSEGGATLRSGQALFGLGAMEDAAEWALKQPALCLQVFKARFAHHPESELRSFVEWLERTGIVARFQPDL